MQGGGQWALATVKLSTVAAAFLITILATGYHGVLGANALLWHEDLDNTMTGPPELPKNLSFGAYDPSHAFADLKDSIAIEHIFVSWLDQDQSAIKAACDYARQRNRWLMITVEPWAETGPTARQPCLRISAPAATTGRYQPFPRRSPHSMRRCSFAGGTKWRHPPGGIRGQHMTLRLISQRTAISSINATDASTGRIMCGHHAALLAWKTSSLAGVMWIMSACRSTLARVAPVPPLARRDCFLPRASAPRISKNGLARYIAA